MKQSLLVVIIVISVAVGAALAITYMEFNTEQTSQKATGDVERAETILVDVPSGMQTCSGNESCLAVDTDCGFCCNYQSINARYEQDYDQLFNKTCVKYKGAFCECFDLSSYPTCQSGKCVLAPWQ